MILRTKETPRFGGVINCVFDTWGGLMHCPTPCDFDTACVHKSLIYLPVVQSPKRKRLITFLLYTRSCELLSKDFLVLLLPLTLPFV